MLATKRRIIDSTNTADVEVAGGGLFDQARAVSFEVKRCGSGISTDLKENTANPPRSLRELDFAIRHVVYLKYGYC